MTLHPSAPEDLPGLVDAFAHTAQAVIDLGRSCREEDFDRPTPCPGWSVQDQIAHVAGLEDWLAGGEVPDVDVPDYPHIRNKAGAFVEKSIEVRRGLPGEEVVDELEAVLAQRLAQLRDPAIEPETVIAGPWGPTPAGFAVAQRTLDVWTHEQDIRAALGRPGNLDSPAAAVFLSLLFQALPKIVAKDAGIEAGNAVIFDVTGPVVGRAGVRVETGEDGTPWGKPLYTGEAHSFGEEVRTTSIVLSTDAITRRAAGRGSLEDIHYTVSGDEQIARRVLEALVFVP